MIVELTGPGQKIVLENGSGRGPPPGAVSTLESMAALRAFRPSSSVAVVVTLTSYYSGLFSGGGTFVWDSARAAAADDGGTAICPTGASVGCWVRLESLTTRRWNA